MYVINVYRKIFSTDSTRGGYELKFVQTLPYRFSIRPINICWQLNQMLGEDLEHIIEVER